MNEVHVTEVIRPNDASGGLDAALWAEIPALMDYAESTLVGHTMIALARLRVADHLGDEPRPVEDVADAAGVDAPTLWRSLRLLEAHQFVRLDDRQAVRLLPRGHILRHDSPFWATLAAPGSFDIAFQMEQVIRTGRSAAEIVWGVPFFDHLARNPAAEAIFGDAMREEGNLLNLPAVPALDLSGSVVVADIGGGTGGLLAAILRANPHVDGILVDQPSVLARAVPELTTGELAQRCTLVPGDFFGELPSASDYVLARVVHDWPDERAEDILAGARRAGGPTSRLHLLELILPTDGRRHVATFSDIVLLLLLGGGRERTEAELQELLANAGWQVEAVVPAGLSAVVTASAA